MKIALVHELLTMRGGAERMLKTVADMFPEAPIYTLLYDEKKLGDWFPRERIRFSRLQVWSPISKNHHLYLKKFPKAVEAWDFSPFDLVISFSSACAHGIKVLAPTKHLSYIHTPARYLWDRTFDVQETSSKGALGAMKRWYLARTFHTLRQWDAEVGDRGDLLLAASKAVRRRIELYWRRESQILYPPVDVDAFPLNRDSREDFYIIVSTLVPYKRIDLAIAACNALKKKLIIIGDGPQRKILKRMGGETIQFHGYQQRAVVIDMLRRAKGFIFPGDEDFGIAPLESMACGTPVVAFGAGGALETVIDGKTGVFFTEPTAASLIDTLKRFEEMSFDPTTCRTQAELFSQKLFEENLKRIIQKMC